MPHQDAPAVPAGSFSPAGHIFSQDVPNHLDSGWLDAANRFAHGNPKQVGEAIRLLQDERMKKFWNGFDQLVESAHATGRLAGDLPMWLLEMRRQLILLLVAKGGAMPKETVGAIARRRSKVAKKLRQLVEEFSADGGLSNIDIEHALSWCLSDAQLKTSEQTRMRRYLGAGNSFVTRPKLLADAIPPFAQPTLCDALLAVANKLETRDKVAWLDPISQPPFAVQPGRGAQAHLEHALAYHFGLLSSPLSGKLWAPAIEVALQLDHGKVSPDALSERFRKIY